MDRVTQLQKLFHGVAELQFTAIGVLQQSAPPAINPRATPAEQASQAAAIAAFNVQAQVYICFNIIIICIFCVFCNMYLCVFKKQFRFCHFFFSSSSCSQ
jgi:hypothetical protein